MFSKKLTIMLVPNSMGVSRQISISRSLLYLLGLVALLVLFTAVYMSAHFFSERVSEKELIQLRAENAKLKEKFEQTRWSLAEIEGRYQELTEKEAHIRSIFSLPEINLEERQLGTGGPEPPSLASMSNAELAAYSTERSVDHMLKLSELQVQEFSNIEQSFLDIEDRLNHTPSIWPAQGWFSSSYGMRKDPFTGYRQMHHGIDIANRPGTPVVATAAGRIARISQTKGMGRMITIDHGYGFKTRYGHLKDSKVKIGDRVERGQVIAVMGNSGRSTGPHLHYEVIRNGKALNPTGFILNDMY